MDEHPYGWLSIAPPVATVILAIVTKRAVLSLLAGLLLGALILSGGNVPEALVSLGEEHLWATFIQPGKLRVLGFTLLMGATIGVLNASGGMQGLVNLIAPIAKTRRRGQLATWLMGLVVFFDDYTNTLLLGSALRPTADRLKISREKLAYLVDSTAAPVAGLALLSTWVAVEIDYINEGLLNCDPESVAGLSAVDLFLGCLPYRFYVIQALLFVPIVALLGRDFGPMLKAERARLASDEPPPDPAFDASGDASGKAPPAPSHWTNAVIPLVTTLGVVLWLIFATGNANLAADTEPTLRNVFGSADSSLSLMYGALAGLSVAMLMGVARKLMTMQGARDAAFVGARAVLPALAILWLASSMSRMTSNRSVEGTPTTVAYEFQEERLYTGDFLQQLLPQDGSSTLLNALLPTLIFLLASAVAFSTGTSFGTMGILLPVITPIAIAALASGSGGAAATDPLLLCCIGSVLAGAIFGDHCSPISDTTILSSQACACDHVAHVVTQMPYALTISGICITLGTLLVGVGVSVWLLLPLQTTMLAGILFWFGQKTELESTA